LPASRGPHILEPDRNRYRLTRRPDPGYLLSRKRKPHTPIQSGGGLGPAKPQQPARQGAVLIPTRGTLPERPAKDEDRTLASTLPSTPDRGASEHATFPRTARST